MKSPTASAVRQGCSVALFACCLLSVIYGLKEIVLPTAAAVGDRVVALCSHDMVRYHIRSTPNVDEHDNRLSTNMVFQRSLHFTQS